MSNARLFLGVDGGGTKTEFVCIDGAGAVVARQIEGTTYHLQVGLDGAVVGIDRFGASAPAEALFPHFGFTVERVVRAVRGVLPAP